MTDHGGESRPGPTGEARDDVAGGTPPPAPRTIVRDEARDEIALDAAGIAEEPVGPDAIADGRTRGTQGPAHATRGQGQGG